jgi:hypothetical protein
MSKLRNISAACCAALYLNLAQAAPLFSFSLLPADGAQSGPAGTSIGWGYSITNRSSDYMVPTAINSDPFIHGTPLALFDFPVIAPNSTVTEAFALDSSGLFQLNWDTTAPSGFVNAGLFELSVSIYDNDPMAAGNLLFTTNDIYTPYSAIVAAAPAPPGPTNIPLPSTLTLLVMGGTMAAWTRNFQRKKT